MLKRAIFAGAALVIGAAYMQIAVTPALAGQIKVKPKISVKPKMRIRVVRPRVRIKINPNQLGRDTLEKKKRDTTPRLAKPGGAPAGYDNASVPAGDDNTSMPGGDIPVGIIFVPNTPTLDVPDGLRDLFELTGGNLNDIRDLANLEDFFGPMAMKELFGGGAGGIPDPVLDGSGMGGRRGGTELGGPAQAGGGVPGNPGHSAGWGGGYSYQIGNTVGRVWTKQTKYGTATFTAERSGSGATTTTVTTPGPNKTSSTETTTTTSTDGTRRRRYIRRVTNSDGTGSHEEGETSSDVTPSAEDQDGNGVPDDVDAERAEAEAAEAEAAEAETGGTADKDPQSGGSAGGGDQGGNYIDPRYSSPRGTIWTPLGGLVIFAVSPSDMTSQPPPSDVQGTVMVGGGSARPNVGAAAVTNTGGGDFIAGEGRGGGGSMIDPCATVAGCGDPGGGGIAPGPAGGPSSSN